MIDKPKPTTGRALARLVASLCLATAAGWGACGGGATPVTPVVSPTPGPTPTPIATPTPTPTPTTSPTPPALTEPTPQATPDSCPMLTSWYSTIHNITDWLQRPTSTPMEGGHVVVDSTPLFNGRSCNAEHNFCGGRACEDPRGGDWMLLEGTSDYEIRTDGYQMRIGPLKLGHHRWRVCPHYDAMDAEGDPVPQGPDPCTEGQFDVIPQPQ